MQYKTVMRIACLTALVLTTAACDLLSVPLPPDGGLEARKKRKIPWADAPAVVTPAKAKPGAVLVRSHEVKGTYHGARVRCAPRTERLIGGSCHGVTPMKGRPFGHDSADTIGAGWECSYELSSLRGPETSVYALCQVVPAATDPTSDS